MSSIEERVAIIETRQETLEKSINGFDGKLDDVLAKISEINTQMKVSNAQTDFITRDLGKRMDAVEERHKQRNNRHFLMTLEQEKKEDKEEQILLLEKYVQWPWIRDNILVKSIQYGIAILVAWVLAQAFGITAP